MITGGVEAEQLAVVWLLPAIVGVAAYLVMPRSREAVRAVLAFMAAGYLVAIVAITLWPFQADLSPERLLERGNWVPGRGTLAFLLSDNPQRMRLGARDFLANVVLFFPLALVAGVVTRRWLGLFAVLVTAVAVAVGLELLQGIAISRRTLDVDDAISGAIGVLAGVLAAAVIRQPRRT